MINKKKVLSATLAVVLAFSVILPIVFTSLADDARDRYLFAYFTGNDDDQQQIRFALSEDGLNYKALNGNDPIFYAKKHTEHPSSEGYVRDPYINLGEDGCYYMICTDLDAYSPDHGGFFGDTCMYVYKSENLVDWEELTNLDVTQAGAFDGVSGTATTQMYSDPVAQTGLSTYDFAYTIRAWAPQWIWDENEGKYLVYWSNFFNDWHCGVFYSYTTDFVHYSAPQLLYQARNKTTDNTWQAAIDEDIIYNADENKYYMYFKDEQTATIAYVTSDELTGPYSHEPVKIYNGDTGLEGANAFMLNGTLTTFADAYGDGHFVVLESNDYKNFTIKDNTTYDIDKLSPRHGSVVAITRSEYDALAKAYNMSTDDDISYHFNSHSYYDGASLVTMRENEDYATPNDATYHAVKDTSGYWYDVRTPWWTYAYSYRKAHYISFSGKNNDVGGGNIFINDGAVKTTMEGSRWTVSFDVSLTAKDGAPVFALTSGNDAASTKDWLRLIDDGKFYIYKDGGYVNIGETSFETGIEYKITIVYDNASLTLYRDGEKVFDYNIGNIAFDKSSPVSYVAFGWTDTIGANAFQGSISELRFRRQAITAEDALNESNPDDSLVYRQSASQDAFAGRNNILACGSSGSEEVYNGSYGDSYTVAAWVNVGITTDTNKSLFEFGNGGTGDDKQYLTVREDGIFNYCWFEGSTEHYFDSKKVYTFAPNTWYYLQINIVPDGNSVRFMVFVNAQSVYDSSSYDKNVSMNSFDFNPIKLFTSPSLPVSLGTGKAYWGAGSCYIGDVRVYSKALEPNSLMKLQSYDNPFLCYTFESVNDCPSLSGGASRVFDEDKNSRVLTLESSSNAYATLPRSAFDGKDEMTVLFDIKAGVNSGNYFTFTFGQDNTKYDFFRIRGSEVRNAITVNSYMNEQAVSTAVDYSDSWMSVALVFNGTSCKMYVNGILTSENNDTGITVSDLGTNLYSYLGKSLYDGDGYFSGSFDNFEAYSCVLSDEVIKEKAMNNLPLLISASAGVRVSSLDGVSGTDSHTMIKTEIDRSNNTITPVIQRRQNIKSVPVSFYILDSDCRVAIDGVSFSNGENLDLSYDRIVTLTSGDTTQVYTLKAAQIANNPVLPGMYADPDIDVLDGKFWIYPTTDGTPGWGGTQFHAFSSPDMVHWTDEGVILDNKDKSPGVNEKGIQIASSKWSDGNAWAPAIEEKNGKYYFYYCARILDSLTSLYGEGMAIGVAYADSPQGPYTASDTPILYPKMLSSANIGFSGQVIDPAVYTENGKSYILFGNGMAAMADLSSDMLSVDTSTLRIISGLTDFRESVAVFKRNGTYFFTWSCDDTGSENYHINYGTASSLKGSVTNRGTLLQKDTSAGILATGHQSVIYLPETDRCFIAYHRFYTPLSVAGNVGHRRETCIDEITFNSSGLLNTVTPTMTGVGPVDIHGNSIDEIITYATCETDGYITAPGFTLTADDTTEIKSSGHQFRITEHPASCTQDGYNELFCSVCLNTYIADVTPKLGHDVSFEKGSGGYEFRLVCSRGDIDMLFNFSDYINAENGDDNYNEFIDVNGDGIINAKDYALLKKLTEA